MRKILSNHPPNFQCFESQRPEFTELRELACVSGLRPNEYGLILELLERGEVPANLRSSFDFLCNKYLPVRSAA